MACVVLDDALLSDTFKKPSASNDILLLPPRTFAAAAAN
jgi:hypothetical protein